MGQTFCVQLGIEVDGAMGGMLCVFRGIDEIFQRLHVVDNSKEILVSTDMR